MTTKFTWQKFNTSEQVAESGYLAILAVAEQAIRERGVFHVVLAGGTTPEKIYKRLVNADTDWRMWRIYHGDERCLPVDHIDRNSLMAAKAWLDHVPISKEQIFDIPAEKGPLEGARLYTKIIEQALPFDVVLLGMGEDGHTASLFPGHVHQQEALVHPVFNSPKPPPERVTLSAKALSDSREVIFIVTGANKRTAFAQWRAGGDLPVANIKGGRVSILYDEEACDHII